MNTVAKHAHAFLESEWPFSDPTNTAAISTKRVFYDGLPILGVTHDSEGDWQILCGTTTESEHAIVVCLGCAYQRDNSIGELADMPLGWEAWRESAGSPWIRKLGELEDYED